MKVVVTGAHFTVAEAVIEELVGKYKAEVVYIGRKHTLEGDSTLSREFQEFRSKELKYYTLTTGRLQRSFTRFTVPSILKIPVGLLQSFYILLREKPDVVLSFGGYVSLPVVFASWCLSKPIIVHEQTLVSGLANKIGALFADCVAVSFKDGEYSYSSKKVVFSGNPIRRELKEPTKVSDELGHFMSLVKQEKRRLVVVTGGNQGSHVLNVALATCLTELSRKMSLIVQTGESKFRDYEKLLDVVEKKGLSKEVFVTRWLSGSEMGAVLKRADLVVCRAGVNTLVELAYFNVPAVVVPIPYLHNDEQMKNARYFEKLGLVAVLEQNKLDGTHLREVVQSRLEDIDEWKLSIKGVGEQVVVTEAASRVALETVLLCKGL